MADQPVGYPDHKHPYAYAESNADVRAELVAAHKTELEAAKARAAKAKALGDKAGQIEADAAISACEDAVKHYGKPHELLSKAVAEPAPEKADA